MNILTVYANPNPRSFCHSVLESFTRGLSDSGHSYEIADLYAMKFNPVLNVRDFSNWIGADTPVNILKSMLLHNSGGPIQQFFTERWLRNKDSKAIARLVRRLRPRDVVKQQQKVAWARVWRSFTPCGLWVCPLFVKVGSNGFSPTDSPFLWRRKAGRVISAHPAFQA
jgi:NAD(P)H dehydrogenase (quinone)